MFASVALQGAAGADPPAGEKPWPSAADSVTGSKQRECLAIAIYHEARGEPAVGQKLVGRVILNRVASRFYPNSVCEIVYQNAHRLNRCQFSFACSGEELGISEKRVWRQIKRRADALIHCLSDNDCQESQNHSSAWISTHYHADYVKPFWAEELLRLGQVGRHIFYHTRRM